jgi:hypothetical protein
VTVNQRRWLIMLLAAIIGGAIGLLLLSWV